MAAIGLGDTDSCTLGMCTTYLATPVAEAVEARGGIVERWLLVRSNLAVEHKTRGNAALAIHTGLPVDAVFDPAHEEFDHWAILDDGRTSPGVVVAPGSPNTVSTTVADFARDAIRDFHDLDDAVALAECPGFLIEGWHGGRSRIGTLTVVGAWAVFGEWAYEHISYRELHRCRTLCEVDADSAFDVADTAYPDARDTVDRKEGEGVCVSSAPGSILHGIRGDNADTVREAVTAIDSEPVDRSVTFRTNQRTDAHLRDGVVSDLRDGRAYRVAGTVASGPETRWGGRAFFDLEASDTVVTVVASEPTKRLRNRVRALRVGDAITACSEVEGDILKLEKLAARDLVWTEPATPVCFDRGRTMRSAGRNQGYWCRNCRADIPGKAERTVDRDLEPGWYEVPPCVCRHIAKPLVRGDFDAATHPEC